MRSTYCDDMLMNIVVFVCCLTLLNGVSRMHLTEYEENVASSRIVHYTQ